MNKQTQSQAIGLTILAGLIAAAAFLPWGNIAGILIFGRMTITVTGWQGHLTIAGLTLPNALVPVAAIGVATAFWLRALEIFNFPKFALIAVGIYGLLHVGAAACLLTLSEDGSIAIGTVIAAILMIGLNAVLFKIAPKTKVAQ